MSSIPLPALGIRPPEQQPNALQTLAQIQQLRMMPGQMQRQQQEIQAGALENQQRQQQLKDQQAATSAMQEWDGKDIKDLPPLMLKHGASANAVFGMKKNILEQQTQYSTIAKNDAETGEKNLAILKGKNDMVLGAIKSATDVPDEQLGQHLAQTVQNLTQQGILDPQHAQQAAGLIQGLQSGQLPPAQARKALDIFEKSLQGNSQQFDQAAKEAETAKNAAEAKKTTLETEQLQKFGGLSSAAADAKYRFLAQKQALGQQISAEDAAYMKGYERQKEIVPKFNFNLQAGGVNNAATPTNTNGEPLKGEDLYKTFGGKAGIVKAIVEGRQTPPASFAQKSPYWQDVMQKVYQVDPQFNEQRAQLRKAFTTGPDAKNIGSLNTAAVHLDTLSEAAKALNNGTFKPGNQAFNAIKTMFGASAPNTFEGIRDAVASEMASALKGNATDIEIAGIKKTIMSSSSPQQLTDLVNAHLHILNQKLNTYKERYEQQNPGDTVYSPVLPSAGAVFQKHGVGGGAAQGGGGITVTAPNGKTYSFKDQASADAFKARAGIK